MAIETKENPTLVKEIVVHEMRRNPLLVAEHGVYFYALDESHLEAFAQNYRRAYRRGDFFASRYSDPESQIFNPNWLSREIANPNNIWTVFIREGDFIGATGLFYENGGITSDETQLDVKGRGFGTMKHFLRRIVPVLDSLGVDIAADFLLTPQSKSLRTTLQGELSMTALGIHPYELAHRQRGNLGSVISARKFHHLNFQTPVILPQLSEIYGIVAKQLSGPEPIIIKEAEGVEFRREFGPRYQEVIVCARDPKSQHKALVDGFSPVKFDPRLQTFTMAKFPPQKPDFSFIASENIEANSQLVNYLNKSIFEKIE